MGRKTAITFIIISVLALAAFTTFLILWSKEKKKVQTLDPNGDLLKSMNESKSSKEFSPEKAVVTAATQTSGNPVTPETTAAIQTATARVMTFGQ